MISKKARENLERKQQNFKQALSEKSEVCNNFQSFLSNFMLYSFVHCKDTFDPVSMKRRAA